MENERLTKAQERMEKEGVGLAKHGVECTDGIDWVNTRTQGNESRLRDRNVREGIESLRAIHGGQKVLHSLSH